jgi:hypothetical protein
MSWTIIMILMHVPAVMSRLLRLDDGVGAPTTTGVLVLEKK